MTAQLRQLYRDVLDRQEEELGRGRVGAAICSRWTQF